MIRHVAGQYILVFLLFFSVDTFPQQDSLSFLALGDSYTAGTSELTINSWPLQFAQLMDKKGVPLKPPTILAGAGWTTDDLLSEINTSNLETEYDLVSLLIGVNNQYRGLDIDQFKDQFKELLDKSVKLAGNNTSRVFVLSIPDWGVTPFARFKDKDKIRRELTTYNAIIEVETEKRGILFIEITKLSQQALWNKSLIASDSLHPSAKMYKDWAKKIQKKVLKQFP
ncbi:SGNH/GDSL hydrolase family protein [Maribacter arenosus]|uniref:SGNH/GDSL hydrolase family protein n=1 Tax=Maribacter arenosus TaxID=1854708 RepID=A0ABR7VCV2_9FLAO|nr:SGNH/GDSL hydrolase family protein [Maribacter arenosus]MBD0851193.1 SGNH/GDSL hydrolase family protein [Maribacter arenosus]